MKTHGAVSAGAALLQEVLDRGGQPVRRIHVDVVARVLDE